MAEEATAEAVEAAPVEVETTEQAGTGDPLIDALAGFNPDEPAKDPEKPDAADKEKEKPEPDKKPEPGKKKTRAELEAFLFSPEEIEKPEGREKAIGYLRQRQSKLDGIDVRLQAKGATLAKEKEAAQNWFDAEHARLETDRAYARRLAELRPKLEDPADMNELLTALGTLTRKDGRELWENWAKFAMQGGKRGEPTQGERAAREEIAGLKGMISELAARLDRAPVEQEEAAAQAEIATLAPKTQELERATLAEAADGEKYPVLSTYAALPAWRGPIIESVIQLRREARAAGRELDRAGALATINAELAKAHPAGARPASPKGVTPTDPVAVRATSIAPSQARSMQAVRDKTEAELADDLARDIPALEAILGTSLSA